MTLESDFFRADCHIHTTCSDGTFSAQEIILEAQKRGLKGISITDHDTVSAYDDALTFAYEQGIKLLPGAELSAFCDSTPIHILAFGFTLTDDKLNQLMQSIQSDRIARLEGMIGKLQKCGFDLTLSELQDTFGHSTITRSHLAQMMINKGLIKDSQSAFKKYLGDKARAYVPLKKIPVKDIIDIIHASGGKAILAHPHKIKSKNVLKKVLSENFDGLEGHYGVLSQKQEQPFIQIAKAKNWLVTGGSDFHGHQNHLKLGASWTPQETFHDLYQLAIRNNPKHPFISDQ